MVLGRNLTNYFFTGFTGDGACIYAFMNFRIFLSFLTFRK